MPKVPLNLAYFCINYLSQSHDHNINLYILAAFTSLQLKSPLKQYNGNTKPCIIIKNTDKLLKDIRMQFQIKYTSC